VLVAAASVFTDERAQAVSIGERCLLGDEVMVSDRALTVEDALGAERPVVVRPVVVGDAARVGPRACLLAGAHGEGLLAHVGLDAGASCPRRAGPRASSGPGPFACRPSAWT
jgi:carbonic anhydrase/acetyltransferase-like protein (isoleucine patch superfamily)